MSDNLNILILEDNQSDADLLHRELNKSGLSFTSEIVQTREDFENALQRFNPDIILSDYSLPAFDAVTAFHITQKASPHTPFIIVSGIIGEENAVELIKKGVTDYAPKDKLFTLPTKINRALKDTQERKEKEIIVEKLKMQTAELLTVNKELVLQNEEKEKRAVELIAANNELLSFTYISSHDLQEPLRKIQIFAGHILGKENQNLSDTGKDYFQRIQSAAERMQRLIEDLLVFSRVNSAERIFTHTDLNIIIEEVKSELKDAIQKKRATIEVAEICPANIIRFQFHQLMHNLISNALKFSNPDIPPHIIIKSRIAKGSTLQNKKLSPEKDYCHISVKDNGIGFEPEFHDRIFEVFQRLHEKSEYTGTGIGLAIVQKIVDNHNGIITATSETDKGATFDIYIPA